MNTVEYPPEVSEADVQWCLSFHVLLNDVPEYKYLAYAVSFSLKLLLLFTLLAIHWLVYKPQEGLAEYFTRFWKQGDTIPIIKVCEVAFPVYFHNEALRPVLQHKVSPQML